MGELNRAGYKVLGVDQSPAMIKLARSIAPESKFQVGSLLSAKLPACDGVTSIGECLNYCFDESNSRTRLRGFFRRVHRALRPGGVFVFDIAEPSRLP
jgi:SAM-dependent methyltransferase